TSSPPFDLRVLLSGGGAGTEFTYRALQSGAPKSGDVSDFTVTFGPSAMREIDVRIVGKPGNQFVDCGGDLHVKLPGEGRTLPIELYAGETNAVPGILPLDGDTQSIAAYGAQVALAWPARSGQVATVPVTLDRVEGGVQGADRLGGSVKKVRVTS